MEIGVCVCACVSVYVWLCYKLCSSSSPVSEKKKEKKKRRGRRRRVSTLGKVGIPRRFSLSNLTTVVALASFHMAPSTENGQKLAG